MCTQVYIETRAKEVHGTFCFAYTFNLTLSVRGAVSYLQPNLYCHLEWKNQKIKTKNSIRTEAE